MFSTSATSSNASLCFCVTVIFCEVPAVLTLTRVFLSSYEVFSSPLLTVIRCVPGPAERGWIESHEGKLSGTIVQSPEEAIVKEVFC